MDFGGKLSVLEPTTVFQVINMSGLTGVLKLITINNVARFYFEKGELIFASIEARRKRIGEFLIERELISEKQFEKALGEYRKNRGTRKIGHFLIEGGYLDRDSLVSAIREQIKEVVYEAIRWKTGEFIFLQNVKPEKEDILLDVKLDFLILEGLKRLDEDSGEP